MKDYLGPLVEWQAGVVDENLVAAQCRRCAALLAGRPRTVAEALGVYVLHGQTCDGCALVVGQDCRDGRVHDERDQEEEREHGEDGGRTETKRRVELGLLQEALDLIVFHTHRGTSSLLLVLYHSDIPQLYVKCQFEV